MTRPLPAPVRGYLLAVTSAALLSTTAVFIRHLTLTYQMPALVLAFWRDLFVIAALLPALLVIRPRLVAVERRHLPYLATYGLVLAAFNVLWTLSVACNGAAIATVLVYCSSAFSAVLGWWFLGEELRGRRVAAVTLGLVGCILVSGALSLDAWHSHRLGMITGAGSGLAYALYSLMGRSAAMRGLSPWTTLLHTFSFATLFLLVANLLPDGPLPGSARSVADLGWLGTCLPAWGTLVLLAVGPTVLGFGLYNVSLVHLPATVANLVLTLEPVFTLAMAYGLLGEQLQGLQVGGGLLIVGGVLLCSLPERGKLPVNARRRWRERRPNLPVGREKCAQ